MPTTPFPRWSCLWQSAEGRPPFDKIERDSFLNLILESANLKKGRDYQLSLFSFNNSILHIKKQMEKTKVVIIQGMSEDFFHLYNEAGQMIESSFDSYKEAERWAEDNGYLVVSSFNF